MYVFLKPFIYYYSLTYNIKFVREHILLMDQIGFSYSNEFKHTFKNGNISEIESIREFNKKNYDEELVNKGHFFTDSIRKLTMHIGTVYYGNDHDDFVQTVRELEENGERVGGTLSTPLREEESEEESEEEPIINTEKSFKSDQCVICLTNPPNVLFCNCGHPCLCVECNEVKSLKICPVCKTEKAIKRTTEY